MNRTPFDHWLAAFCIAFLGVLLCYLALELDEEWLNIGKGTTVAGEAGRVEMSHQPKD